MLKKSLKNMLLTNNSNSALQIATLIQCRLPQYHSQFPSYLSLTFFVILIVMILTGLHLTLTNTGWCTLHSVFGAFAKSVLHMETLHWHEMSSTVSIGTDSWVISTGCSASSSFVQPQPTALGRSCIGISGFFKTYMLDSCYVEDLGRVSFYKVATNHFALGFYKVFYSSAY